MCQWKCSRNIFMFAARGCDDFLTHTRSPNAHFQVWGGGTTGHRARGTNGQICKACRAGVWKCAQCPRETLLEAPSPADMIQSPALLWPHKAARAAPIAGGTREKFRGAVITPDWLRCVVTDRSPFSGFSGSALSALSAHSPKKSARLSRITETLLQLFPGSSPLLLEDGHNQLGASAWICFSVCVFELFLASSC